MKKLKQIFVFALCALVAVSSACTNGEAEDPVTDDPVIDNPVTDDPVTDDPITDDPTAELRHAAFWTEGDEEENQKFRAFTADVFKNAMASDMLNLHYTVKEPASYGIERPAMDLFAVSDFDNEAILAALSEYDFSLLSRENQITYAIMQEDLTDAVAWSDLAPLSSSFSYSSGIQVNLVTIATEYEFFIEQDIRDYLDMMEQIPAYFSYLFEGEEERVAAGYGYPDFLLEEIIAQFDEIVSEGEDSCFLSSFEEKINAFEGISDGAKQDYIEENRVAVTDGVLPAYEQTAEKLSGLFGTGVNELGLIGYEGGKEYYEMAVKVYSGWDGSVEELYSALEKYSNSLYNDLVDLVTGSQSAYMQYSMWANGKVVTPTDPVEILDYFSQAISEIFPAIGNTTYSVKYLSEAVANTMPNTLAYYMIPQIDNYEQGFITVNGYASDDGGMMNTLCHEGYPGHLYQNVYFMSQSPDPVRSLFSFSGYNEGWAVYAANRAAYLYSYDSKYSLFPSLDEINISYSYALFSLLDIGVNYFGWGTEEVADLLGADNDTAELYLQIFIEMPGVYLSYGAGNMQMYSLRSRAKTLAGSSFDEVEFHQLILEVGPCNFGLLSSLLDEYYTV